MDRKPLAYALSAIVGLAAIVMLCNMTLFVGRSIAVEATVLEKLGSSYVVSFADITGNTMRAEIPLPAVRSGARRKIVVGETVSILYDPNDPSSVKRNTFSSLWLFPLLLGCIAIVPIGIFKSER
jgi:hypothetical protein